jgi:hypothetical protein
MSAHYIHVSRERSRGGEENFIYAMKAKFIHGLFVCLERGSHYIFKVGLQLAILLLQSHKCWNYRHELLSLADSCHFETEYSWEFY